MPRQSRAMTKTLARNIRRLRVERGLTLLELARRVGVRESTESYRERGLRVVPLDALSHYARALGVTAEDLIADKKKETTHEPKESPAGAQ